MRASIPNPPVGAPDALPLRQQLDIRNAWLTERLETVLPALMAREQIDLWLVIAREYNEDPVILSLIPQPAMSARRRTILAFHRAPDGTVKRFSIDRYGFPGFYEPQWQPESGEAQYACLARIVRDLNPARIGLNTSDEWPFGDGLSHSEYARVIEALGPDLAARVVSAERLCVGWLETRIPAEMTAYPAISAMGHALIAEAFSGRVIHPGVTTTDDVVWWLRQAMLDRGLTAWFHPTIEIQARGQGVDNPAPGMKRPNRRTLIMPGDLLHCDVGFTYLGLTTDQQQHAYVLRPGEADAPDGLKSALAEGNKLQSILMNEMGVGRTGNEVLAAALDVARTNGLRPSIYSHPLGVHGHAAGPTIGLWDQQDGVPGQGDYPLYDNTVYSIELNIVHSVPEWGGQDVRIALEEDAALTDGQMRWLHGRQTAFHLIGG
jgi:hypothetical protein